MASRISLYIGGLIVWLITTSGLAMADPAGKNAAVIQSAITVLFTDDNELKLSDNGITRSCNPGGLGFMAFSDITNNSGQRITIHHSAGTAYIDGEIPDHLWYVTDPLGAYITHFSPIDFDVANGETFVVLESKDDVGLCDTEPEIDFHLSTSLGEYRVCDGTCN